MNMVYITVGQYVAYRKDESDYHTNYVIKFESLIL